MAFPTGSLLAVFGPNGGGKSTMLKVIAGLLAPWQGTVTVLGAAPRVHARRVAYVPQAEQVDWDFPVTCWDVVAMGRYPSIGPFRGLARSIARRWDPPSRWSGWPTTPGPRSGGVRGQRRRASPPRARRGRRPPPPESR